MNYRTQETLTVLFSSVIFGAAGYWIIPDQIKGVAVGAGGGGIVAAGYVQQNRRLKRLEQILKQPQQVGGTQRRAIQLSEGNTKSSANGQVETGRAKPGQATLNRKEINAIQRRLNSLEDQLYDLSTTQVDLLGDVSSNHEEEVIDQQDILPTEEVAQDIASWFANRHIHLKNAYQSKPGVDEFLDDLSLYLGDNYSTLRFFHRKLKSNIGKRIHFGLEEQSDTECSIHREYLKKLRDSALLSFGRYFEKETKFILAATHNRKDIMGFLSGGWFERFIYHKTVEAFDDEGVDYQYLRNPVIAYPNENASEIDLFFLVNKKPLLIECKSGRNYDEGIEKFASHCRKLGLPLSRSIFVVLELEEAQATLRTKQWGITVVNESAFIDHIKNLAEEESDKQSQEDFEDDDREEETKESELTEPDEKSLENFFQKRKLNLSPDKREVVFTELVQLFEQLDQTMSFNEITKTIRDRLSNKSPLARNKVYEILNALRMSNCLRNQYGKSERNVAKPISKVHKLNVTALEKKAMEYYTKQILQRFDPDFFDDEANVAEFERLTLGAAPTPEKILEIKQR